MAGNKAVVYVEPGKVEIDNTLSEAGTPGWAGSTEDPGGVDAAAKVGSLSLRLGLGWAKSHSFTTGQCPVMKYNRGLMMCILYDKVRIADAVNATVIPLDAAQAGLDPNGFLGAVV